MKSVKSVRGASRDRQRGSVLLLALFVTLIILGIGLTVMWVASSSTKVSGNLTRRHEAFNVAEAGIERARAILFAPANANDWKPLLAGCGANPADTDTIGRILCDTGPTPLVNIPLVATGSTTDTETKSELRNMNYTVWIRNDWGAECDDLDGKPSKVDCDHDGTEETDTKKQLALIVEDKNRRVIVRSRGVARDGISTVTLEVIISSPTVGGGTPSYSQAGLNAQGSSSGTVVIAPP